MRVVPSSSVFKEHAVYNCTSTVADSTVFSQFKWDMQIWRNNSAFTRRQEDAGRWTWAGMGERRV